MKLEGVIFDWAGTTVDYGCFAPVKVFINIFKKRGIEVTLEEAREPMGLLKRDHIKTMLLMERVQNLWNEKFERQWTEEDVDDLYTDFENQLFTILPKYTTPVTGCLEVMKKLRERNLKIGSTTGYTKEMAEIVGRCAEKKGYAPDYMITASEVPKGRPSPYMIFDNMINLNLDSREKVVKVGDTISDIKEGRNAGIWTVGLIKGSSELGLSEEEVNNMNSKELKQKIDKVRKKMIEAGAHLVIENISKVDEVIDTINEMLERGIRP